MNNRRFRCATPPVIHNATASAAILLSQNNLLRNSTEILPKFYEESFVPKVLKKRTLETIGAK
jgi:hypothetical protein